MEYYTAYVGVCNTYTIFIYIHQISYQTLEAMRKHFKRMFMIQKYIIFHVWIAVQLILPQPCQIYVIQSQGDLLWKCAKDYKYMQNEVFCIVTTLQKTQIPKCKMKTYLISQNLFPKVNLAIFDQMDLLHTWKLSKIQL